MLQRHPGEHTDVRAAIEDDISGLDVRLSGVILVLLYILVLPVLLAKNLFKPYYEKLGAPRYYVTVFLFLMMMSLPAKMLARWIFNLKYIVNIPEFAFNI